MRVAALNTQMLRLRVPLYFSGRAERIHVTHSLRTDPSSSTAIVQPYQRYINQCIQYHARYSASADQIVGSDRTGVPALPVNRPTSLQYLPFKERNTPRCILTCTYLLVHTYLHTLVVAIMTGLGNIYD
jgi:hypothetical protein